MTDQAIERLMIVQMRNRKGQEEYHGYLKAAMDRFELLSYGKDTLFELPAYLLECDFGFFSSAETKTHARLLRVAVFRVNQSRVILCLDHKGLAIMGLETDTKYFIEETKFTGYTIRAIIWEDEDESIERYIDALSFLELRDEIQ
jgi:hypothetical protein